jgi:hypothetical protein
VDRDRRFESEKICRASLLNKGGSLLGKFD